MGATSYDPVQQLLAACCGYALAVEIQDIPYLFTETRLKRSDADADMSIPARFDKLCPALYFGEDVELSGEFNESGVEVGDALEFILSWEALEAAGLETFFGRPTKRTRLIEDFNWDDNVAEVAMGSVDSWQEGERAYIGRESFPISLPGGPGKSTYGLYRDEPGTQAYNYSPLSPSTFSWITDRPEVWAKRDVVLHLHVLTPEGRSLDSTWGEGLYHRIMWRGSIELAPKPTELGFLFKALPLTRLADEPLGHELGVEIVTPIAEDARSFWDYPVVVSPESQITIAGEYTGGGGGEFSYTCGGFSEPIATTIGEWCGGLRTQLNDALLAEPWYTDNTVEVGLGGVTTDTIGRSFENGQFVLKIPYAAPTYNVTAMTLTVVNTPALYWLQSGSRVGKKGYTGDPIWHWTEGWPMISLGYPAGSWLPVIQTSGEGYADLVVPETGTGLVEIEGTKELIRWDAIEALGAPQENVVLLHIAERGVGSTPHVDLSLGGELKFVSGHDGTPAEVMLTLLQSSGTGQRGDYDTLSIGCGYGIPSDWIDEASFLNRIEINEEAVAAYSDGRVSFAELLGGWLSLNNLCLVQRRMPPDGEDYGTDQPYKLMLVRTDPGLVGTADGRFITIEKSDCELEDIESPELEPSPTEVRVSRSGVERDYPDVVSQDVHLIQSQGLVSAEYSAPGMSEMAALDAANSLIASSAGRQIITISVVPWVAMALQNGDLTRLNIGHPAIFNYATGQRAPASIACRVVGWRWNLARGTYRLTLRMAGMAPEGLYLARSATVTNVYGLDGWQIDQLTTEWMPTASLVDCVLYNPGAEDTEVAYLQVYADGSQEFGINAGTMPVWIEAGKTRMTLMGYDNGNDPELDEISMFYRDALAWSH